MSTAPQRSNPGSVPISSIVPSVQTMARVEKPSGCNIRPLPTTIPVLLIARATLVTPPGIASSNVNSPSCQMNPRDVGLLGAVSPAHPTTWPALFISLGSAPPGPTSPRNVRSPSSQTKPPDAIWPTTCPSSFTAKAWLNVSPGRGEIMVRSAPSRRNAIAPNSLPGSTKCPTTRSPLMPVATASLAPGILSVTSPESAVHTYARSGPSVHKE